MGEVKIGNNQFHDAEFEVAIRAAIGQLPPVLEPFADEAMVFESAGFGAMGTEVVVVARERDHGLPGRPVFSIGWNRSRKRRHGEDLPY
jgi:hypothetical protein